MTSLSLGRRRATVGGIALIAVLALAGCSSPDEEPIESPSEGSGDSTFPVTIDAAYGEVTVQEKPTRIVSLTPRNLEFLSYLDEEPLAWNAYASESIEDTVSVQPYLAEIVTSDPDANLTDNTEWVADVEAIAALEPDLILTGPWTVDEQLYSQLSQIAPTYAGLEASAWSTWQEDLATIAELTGHDPEAAVDGVEADLTAAFADAAERLPGLQGATAQAPTIAPDNVLSLADWGNDVYPRFGLVLGEGQDAEDNGGVSWENIDLLTADVLFVGASGSISDEAAAEGITQLQSDPRFAELPASKNGTVIVMDGFEYSAINGGTPASVVWWLDQIVPRLESSALNQSAE